MSALAGIPTGQVSKLKGTGYKSLSTPTMEHLPHEVWQSGLKAGTPGYLDTIRSLGGLAGGGSEADWQKLEAPALRQFGALQGNLASRFSQAGARRSSGFQNTQSEAGTDLAERLQSQRMGIQQNAQSQLLELMQSLLGAKTFETNLLEGKQKENKWLNLLGSLLGGAAGSFGGGIGTGTGIGLAGKAFPKILGG